MQPAAGLPPSGGQLTQWHSTWICLKNSKTGKYHNRVTLKKTRKTCFSCRTGFQEPPIKWSTAFHSFIYHTVSSVMVFHPSDCFICFINKVLWLLQTAYSANLLVDAICGAIYLVILTPNCFCSNSALSAICSVCFKQLILQICYLMPSVAPSIVMFQLPNCFYNTSASSTTCFGC